MESSLEDERYKMKVNETTSDRVNVGLSTQKSHCYLLAIILKRTLSTCTDKTTRDRSSAKR